VPSDVRVGVVSFATTAGVDLAPTTDRAAVQKVVNGLRSRGDTSLYAGVRSAVGALGTKGDRSIVLLSDGADTVSDDKDADLARVTSSLKSAGIRVDVVRFKSDDPDATQALRGFAAANGGSVVSADDTAGVSAAFRASAKALESQVPFEIVSDQPLDGSHTIQIKGQAGDTRFSLQRAVDFSAAVAAPATPAPPIPGPALALPVVPTAAAPSWLPLLAAALIGLGLFALVTATLMPTLQTQRERRVDSIESYVVGPKAVSRSENKTHAAPLSEQLTALGDKVMSGRKSTSWVVANIERADLPFRVGEWLVLQIVSAIVGVALGLAVFRGLPLLGLALGLVLGLVLPPLVLRSLATRRAKAFERVLPDVLMLVATSLRSGFGLPQALDAVARDAAEPAAKEFSRALAETRIGTDIADALDHAADRMDSKSLRWTTMAIRIQREVGGNLAETLLTTANTLRERESLFRQVRTFSAEGRLSAWILIALPVGMFFYMMSTNYEYVSLLWTTTLGVVMLIASLVMFVIGIFWMRRVVRIEV
jgi:tight adherence protein B